jgi:hypothetical protein
MCLVPNEGAIRLGHEDVGRVEVGLVIHAMSAYEDGGDEGNI